jgi:amidohydrolase
LKALIVTSSLSGGLFSGNEMDAYQKACQSQRDTIAIRRHLHQYPELSFQEHQSSAFVSDKLRCFGFEVSTGIGQTGVVGLLRGGSEKPCIMLRFDMDALPVEEANEFDYCSKDNGKMHACGHDAHMAIGLGVARLLAENRDRLKATIKLIFQPAEEVGLGALAMIEAGVLDNPKPDYVVGLHVWNEKPLGWVGATSGPVMAGSDMFRILVKGKGGHGAAPQQAIDPIVAASQLVNSLQSIVSRNINPLDHVVISVGSIHGGTASNIIPSEVELTGTIRFFQIETQSLIHRRLQEIAEWTSSAFNCQCEVEIIESTGPVVNDPMVTKLAVDSLQALGQDLQVDTDYRTLISEDMAFFLERIPGVFLFIGSGAKAADQRYPHHHPRFDIQEDCMVTAVAAVLELVHSLSEIEA